MKTRAILTAFAVLLLCAAEASGQQKIITGKVTDEAGAPVAGASIVVRGTTTGALSNASGNYSLRVNEGQVLQFRYIGTLPAERTVGADNVINVQLRRAATSLDAVVVTALGQTTAQRALGTSLQQVSGSEIAGTQRENFINALQGRVAGVDVVSTSGTPGASSSITIRGVSSISSSNQPLMVVDGLPIDNKTMNTNVLGSDASSGTAFNNRGVDFTNRSADINPEDIESLTVLKGPEAAALYGIDAANGAIIIVTKRGRAGVGGFEYNNRFRIENVRTTPDLQRTFGPTTTTGGTLGSFQYFGVPYAAGTQFYDNMGNFFRTGATQTHNFAFSGAAQDNRLNYRVASSFMKQKGVVRNTEYDRINVTGSTGAQVTSWLKSDLSMLYSYVDNDQVYKGDGGPFIGLMLWPQTDNAEDYLSAAGTRRRITALSTPNLEVDNPFFNINKNPLSAKTNRINTNVGLTLTPWSWGDVSTRIGADAYTNQNQLLRHPESAAGYLNLGIIDQADDIVRNLNIQTLVNVRSHALTKSLSVSGLVGNAVQDNKSTVDALVGLQFLDPNFISINNANVRSSKQTISQRRLISGFGSAIFHWNHYLYVTITGRNDWTSTIPVGANSFFYPSANASLILTDAFQSLRRYMTSGKLRAGYAEVGRDARPYAYRPSLEYKTTAYGGYGYGFTGPNLALKPEFKRAYELGTELAFLDDRLGLDVTVYRNQTTDQIVNDIRGPYATGFILFNLNGAKTQNQGLEITARGAPVRGPNRSWEVSANFASARGKTLALPNALPESYVSDTWLYGDVRNGTAPGLSTMSLTGRYYLRNNNGELLIDPASGLPLRPPAGTFLDAGYDRQPDWTMGLQNTLRFNKVGLSFLVDFRRGGDVFNATEHYLTTRGLAASTVDRETPRVINGVLRDGKENSANPTRNTIVVIPSLQTGYYTAMSEELFIEKDINWVRLRDVTLTYNLPERFARNANIFITGTDIFLLTNYSGLDPISNGTSASVGGSGGVGIDFGNFPIARGVNFGMRMGF